MAVMKSIEHTKYRIFISLQARNFDHKDGLYSPHEVKQTFELDPSPLQCFSLRGHSTQSFKKVLLYSPNLQLTAK